MDIQVDNISFSYGQEAIIKNLDCRFGPGKFYSILGPNGSGKTTLLDLVSGFIRPDKGTIFVDGIKSWQFSKQKMAKTISLVSQSYNINFPFSVDEVVMMGRHPYIGRFGYPSQTDRDLADHVMETSGITHLKHRKITELSGGEKQRCILARALCQDTPFLLLDEAFSNMDIRHTLHMLGIIKQAIVELDKTIIAVLHDLNLAASWADHLIFLKKGKIMADGPTQDVLNQENIEAVFEVRSKVEFNEYVQARQVYFKKD